MHRTNYYRNATRQHYADNSSNNDVAGVAIVCRKQVESTVLSHGDRTVGQRDSMLHIGSADYKETLFVACMRLVQ